MEEEEKRLMLVEVGFGFEFDPRVREWTGKQNVPRPTHSLEYFLLIMMILVLVGSLANLFCTIYIYEEWNKLVKFHTNF